MKKFTYSLQQIVDLKSSEKTHAELLLSNALAKQNEQTAAMEELQLEKQALLELLAMDTEQQTTVSRLVEKQEYIRYLDKLIVHRANELELAKLDVHRKKDKLVHNVKEDKLWSQAREKAFHLYSGIRQKVEQKEMDELATTRYIRPTSTN